MKWFKHYSRSRRDNKITAIMDEFGLAGYWYYFALIEVVSEDFKPGSNDQNFTYSMKVLAKELRVNRPKLERILHITQRIQLISCLVINQKDCTFNIPKFSELHDDYTRKLRTLSGQVSGESPPRLDKIRLDKNRSNYLNVDGVVNERENEPKRQKTSTKKFEERFEYSNDIKAVRERITKFCKNKDFAPTKTLTNALPELVAAKGGVEETMEWLNLLLQGKLQGLTGLQFDRYLTSAIRRELEETNPT